MSIIQSVSVIILEEIFYMLFGARLSVRYSRLGQIEFFADLAYRHIIVIIHQYNIAVDLIGALERKHYPDAQNSVIVSARLDDIIDTDLMVAIFLDREIDSIDRFYENGIHPAVTV